MIAKQKALMFATASLALLLTLSVFGLDFDNHVRWNPMLEECVYFHTMESGEQGQCYVEEANCEGKFGNINKDVNIDGCYYVPRNEQGTAGECKEFVEGDLIVLDYSGSDPDSGIGPAGELIYTVGIPFDESNEWQTERGDERQYMVEVTVSDGEYQDMAVVCFDILPGNEPPVLEIEDVTAEEGELVRLKPRCSDPDGDAVSLVFEGDLTESTWQTTYDDAGTYEVAVTCSDGTLSDTALISVTVRDIDRAPELSVRDVTVTETEVVQLEPGCIDPEGDETTIEFEGDLTSATWRTGYEDAGEYSVTVTCTDPAGNLDQEEVTVIVEDRNRPPVITAAVTLG